MHIEFHHQKQETFRGEDSEGKDIAHVFTGFVYI